MDGQSVSIGMDDWATTYRKLSMDAEWKVCVAARSDTQVFEDFEYWAIPMIKGLTPDKITRVYTELGVHLANYIQVSSDLIVDVRHPDRGTYVIKVRNVVEPHHQKIADIPVDGGALPAANGITWLERKVLGLAFFIKTGLHLDTYGRTLCTGTCIMKDFVACVGANQADQRISFRSFRTTRHVRNERPRLVTVVQ